MSPAHYDTIHGEDVDLGIDQDDRRRVSRMACCGLFLLFVMTCTVTIIAAYLSQDSRTLDDMGEHVFRYMDQFESSKTMEHLKQANQDYERVYRPQALASMSTLRDGNQLMKEILEELRREQLPRSVHQFVAETREWMQRIDHLLNRTALHFNVNL